MTVPVLLLAFLSACGGSGGGTGPEPEPPVITVQGVEDGAVIEGSVTIAISVDRGSWEATLNDASFFGGTVADPGSYALEVDARNGEATSHLELSFQVRLAGESVLIVRMFDLGDNAAGGGGDAILLTDSSAAGMEHALVDAGPAGADASDPGYVQRRLAALGVDTLEVMVLTHAHSDHYGGMLPVLEGTTVEDFAYNGQVRSLGSYQGVLTTAGNRADAVVVPEEPTTWTMGYGEVPTTLVVVPGLADHLSQDTDDGSDLNDGSLGTSVTKGPFRMFMTGDGETDANRRWRHDFASLTADLDVLKVGHHGANDAVFDEGWSGSGTTWLEHTAADVQIVSANGVTHPRVAALGALQAETERTYCTNVHGNIEIRVVPDGTWTITVEKNEERSCEEGSEATT